MNRTRLLNAAGIAVALVLAGSWGFAALGNGRHHHADATSPAVASTPAAHRSRAAIPMKPVRRHRRAHHRTVGAPVPTTGTTPTAGSTPGGPRHHPAPQHHSSPAPHHGATQHPGQPSGGSSPSPHSGGPTTEPSPTTSGNLLIDILDGLGHLGH